jgi:hypothetical protein
VEAPDGNYYLHSTSYVQPVVKRPDGTVVEYENASRVYGGAYAQSIKNMASGQKFVVAPVWEGFSIYVPEVVLRAGGNPNYVQEYVVKEGALQTGRRMTAEEFRTGRTKTETKTGTGGTGPKVKVVVEPQKKTPPITEQDILSLLNKPGAGKEELELARNLRKRWLVQNPDALKTGTAAEKILKDINQAMQKREQEDRGAKKENIKTPPVRTVSGLEGCYIQLKDGRIVYVMENKPNSPIKVRGRDGNIEYANPRAIHAGLDNYNIALGHLEVAKKFPLGTEVNADPPTVQEHLIKHVSQKTDKWAGVHPSVEAKIVEEPFWWADLATAKGMDAPTYYRAGIQNLWQEAVSGKTGVYAFYTKFEKPGEHGAGAGGDVIVVLKPVKVAGKERLMVGTYEINPAATPYGFTSFFLAYSDKPGLQHLEYVVPITFKSDKGVIYMENNPFDGLGYRTLEGFVKKNLKPQ